MSRNPETGIRTLDELKWGLVPSWAKDEKIAYKTINARVESVDTVPSYRGAFRKRRCLIPADSFFEWQRAGNLKQPYSIGMKSGEPFVFAGLWEGWKKPGSEAWLRTCTIITCEPNEFCSTIHTRMPVILPESVHEPWLNGSAGKEILISFIAEEMTAYPISMRVNSPRNNDRAIIDPV